MLRPGGFSAFPPVVKNLLIINGLMFLALMTVGPRLGLDLNRILGLYYPASPSFEPYQIFTHLFMHGSLGHLFSNMFALWMFGSMLENVWGSKRMLVYYILTGLGAAILHLVVSGIEITILQNSVSEYIANPGIEQFRLFIAETVPRPFIPDFQRLLVAWQQSPESSFYLENSLSLAQQLVQVKLNIPTVGASGAVFGILMAFGLMFPNMNIYLFFAIPIKAKYFVMGYGFFELYMGLANNPGDNVAHFAHLGGMLFGFLILKYWQKKRGSYF
jgi:membrane associated rhomboid family serine protease